MNSSGLEKTQAEVLIYANTHAKLNEIIEEFINLRTNNEILNNNREGTDMEAISKRLNETIFDEEYLEKKANKLTNKYRDKDGNIKGDQV